jgi:DNA topoisomerase-1
VKLRIKPPPTDPYESARLSGLRYITADRPGIARRRSGKGFVYVRPDGTVVRDSEDLRRIRSLVIPPAWQSVWICPVGTGHLQAVGIDARGRKQYRYHPLYRKVRDATKFTRMAAFGVALPRIRERVEQDLKSSGLPKNKVLATVVRLLEQTSIRIGNEEYRKQNESFGLTTLRNGHAKIDGQTIRFRFKGKSGKMHDLEFTDRRLARIVHDCQCIPGHELFEYVDQGEPRPINSGDVNEYLREIAGGDFTAKDFRTWNGTREAALALEALGPGETETAAKKNVVEAVKITADRLGNRPATCRKYYIHPFVFEAYEDGTLFDVMRKAEAEKDPFGLGREEVAVMKLLTSYQPNQKRKVSTDDGIVDLLAKNVA